MKRSVEVAVIGAGHAGLNAVKEIRQATDDWVLINGGPLGTTCARIGCMPSKVAIHLADSFKARDRLDRYGIAGGDTLALDPSKALEHIRDLRDTFVDLVLANTTDEMDPEHLIDGYAEFIGPRRIRVGDDEIVAKAVVIATGARSVVPNHWQEAFGDRILTVDTLFDQETLPRSVAVIGLGPVGIEIGQALRRMGVSVTGIDHGQRASRLADPAINRAAIEILGREFPLWFGDEPEVEPCCEGLRVRAGQREVEVERLFVSLGRRPNLERLGLERLGVPITSRGAPRFDPETLKVGRHRVFVAGDATGGLATLQRASAQGRIAGYNATHRRLRRYQPGTPMWIVFSDPNIACVGASWNQLDERHLAVAERRFGPVGRTLIMGQNRGLLRVYADRRDGRLLGAAMIGPRCEHLAHLLAWGIESGLTVETASKMPFYHPVIEEALQEALIELQAELARSRWLHRLFRGWKRRSGQGVPAATRAARPAI
ncbi:dihydrolipoyl dehydrogenase [Thioalkalicoccus limnaeus]|uniref:Dihydrolipoyl dehydrogenase n=1 Tax=Thioalkalicoccus limnaeus TaxID=120681 RepID=A0ABV4BCA7_9GAMM